MCLKWVLSIESWNLLYVCNFCFPHFHCYWYGFSLLRFLLEVACNCVERSCPWNSFKINSGCKCIFLNASEGVILSLAMICKKWNMQIKMCERILFESAVGKQSNIWQVVNTSQKLSRKFGSMQVLFEEKSPQIFST